MKVIKICGIHNLNDYRSIISNYIYNLGFISYNKSSRFYISSTLLYNLSLKVNNFIVFVNPSFNLIFYKNFNALPHGSISFFQFSGNENINFLSCISLVQDVFISKSFFATENFFINSKLISEKVFNSYSVCCILLHIDRLICGYYGGSGVSINPYYYGYIYDKFKYLPVFKLFSGGINVFNFYFLIKKYQVYVDMSSGVEDSFKRKDCEIINYIINFFSEI